MITLAELKTYLGITDNTQDARLQLVVDAANDYVESITLMNYSGTDKTRSEIIDYRDNVYLGRMGIKSITGIKLYQTNTQAESADIPTDSYTFNSVGRVTLDGNYGDDYNRSHYNAVHITYTYGLQTGETVPAELKLATLQYASEYAGATAGSDSRRVKSESTGSYRIEFAESSVITDVFNKYRTVRVG